MTCADAIIGTRNGVTDVFGQSLPSAFFLAAPAHGIRQVAYRTENAGGAMADGYARISRRIGVVGAQNGPAATLLVPPLAEAMKASVPLLALVQDVPRASRDRHAFQELDHRELFRACTKWTRSLDDPERVDDYVDMAITVATTGRPGPVVLLLPKDVLTRPAPPQPGRRAALGWFPLDRVRPAAEATRSAAELIAAADAPLVVAGGGVHLSGAAPALAALQDLAALPVATTNMGKGAVAEDHPLSLGVIGSVMGRRSRTHHLRSMVRAADVIVLAGTRTNENGTDAWRLFPPEATYVHIDLDGGEIGRSYEAHRLAGDLRLTLEDLRVELNRVDLSKRHARRAATEHAIAEAHRRHEAEAADVTRSDRSPIRPERVMAELDGLLTADTIMVADASYATIWSANYLHAREPGQRFLAPRGLAGLGWGLPMALGAAAACPGRPVVCLAGDGGLGHVWAEIETAVRERLPVTVILFNNGLLGFQKHAELATFGAHTSAIDFSTVDHTAIARACGAEGVRVDDPGDLPAVLKAALARDTPTLVEVIADPDAYPPITSWDGNDDLPV